MQSLLTVMLITTNLKETQLDHRNWWTRPSVLLRGLWI